MTDKGQSDYHKEGSKDIKDKKKEEEAKEQKEYPHKEHKKNPHNEETKKTPRKLHRKGRANKIYRTPPTPPGPDLLAREKSFILDCRATSSISKDYGATNPKLGPVIPPYNSQTDKHVSNYFRYYGVSRTLKKTGQYRDNGTSIEGPVSDRFCKQGPGFYYLYLRNQAGAGHSQETIDGHAQFMKGMQCVSGYNGKYGFRRNTPWLRKTPTPFLPSTIFPTH